MGIQRDDVVCPEIGFEEATHDGEQILDEGVLPHALSILNSLSLFYRYRNYLPDHFVDGSIGSLDSQDLGRRVPVRLFTVGIDVSPEDQTVRSVVLGPSNWLCNCGNGHPSEEFDLGKERTRRGDFVFIWKCRLWTKSSKVTFAMHFDWFEFLGNVVLLQRQPDKFPVDVVCFGDVPHHQFQCLLTSYRSL